MQIVAENGPPTQETATENVKINQDSIQSNEQLQLQNANELLITYLKEHRKILHNLSKSCTKFSAETNFGKRVTDPTCRLLNSFQFKFHAIKETNFVIQNNISSKRNKLTSPWNMIPDASIYS